MEIMRGGGKLKQLSENQMEDSHWRGQQLKKLREEPGQANGNDRDCLKVVMTHHKQTTLSLLLLSLLARFSLLDCPALYVT